MRLNAVKVLGIPITNTTRNEILEEIQKYLSQPQKKSQKSLIIFTPNTEQLVRAAHNTVFAGVLNKADVAIPDAVGVVWGSRILTKNPLKKVIPGVEFMEDLVAVSSDRHVPIGLIGGYGNLAVHTLDCLHKKYPALSGWADTGPGINGERVEDENYFSTIAKRISESKTRIVFVAFGPPKQEYFIERLTQEVPGVVLMAVGGSFDILSGRLRRAPGWIRTLGLEWLWRLMLEPWRIKRQLALVEFIFLVFRQKLFGSTIL